MGWAWTETFQRDDNGKREPGLRDPAPRGRSLR